MFGRPKEAVSQDFWVKAYKTKTVWQLSEDDEQDVRHLFTKVVATNDGFEVPIAVLWISSVVRDMTPCSRVEGQQAALFCASFFLGSYSSTPKYVFRNIC
jgi:hypothetical protein